MDAIMTVLTVVVMIGLLAVVFKIFATPLRWVLKLLLNAVFGFIALFVVNFLGGFIGLSIGMNWINAIIVGVLGVPGIVLLLLVKYLL